MKTFLRYAALLSVVSLIVCGPATGSAEPFSSQKASFSVHVQGMEIPYRMMSIFVMPHESVKLHVVPPAAQKASFTVKPSRGQIRRVAKNEWSWRAPANPGLYALKISKDPGRDTILLNVFVLVPKSRQKGEYLNGYRIGNYPDPMPNYDPPRGFVEVTAKNVDTMLTPHFSLKQFLCKQNEGYPSYIVLKEKLLLKLELILARMNDKGYPCDTFHIMSGYRTPHYNMSIGNVPYSRHIYGGAVDLFVDQNPKDDWMDDLNKDGKIDYKDAAVIYRIVEELYGETHYEPFLGGLAFYKKTVHHGPFIHIDVRGKRARWNHVE